MKYLLFILSVLSVPAALVVSVFSANLTDSILALLGGLVALSAAAICDHVDDLLLQLEKWRREGKPPAPVPTSAPAPFKWM